MTAAVTVTAINMNVAQVTVRLDDGSITSFQGEGGRALYGVTVGDEVQFTHTHALAIGVR